MPTKAFVADLIGSGADASDTSALVAAEGLGDVIDGLSRRQATSIATLDGKLTGPAPGPWAQSPRAP